MTIPESGATLAGLVERFGGEVLGAADTVVRQVATLEEAGPGEISFLANPKYRGQLATTRAGAVILGERDRDAAAIPIRSYIQKFPDEFKHHVAHGTCDLGLEAAACGGNLHYISGAH